MKDVKAVYCSSTLSLAVLELLANTPSKETLRSVRFVAFPVEMPDPLIASIGELPADWNRKPPADSTRQIGTGFLRSSEFPVLRVPSAVVEGELNFLLNPNHPLFRMIHIGPARALYLDGRLI